MEKALEIAIRKAAARAAAGFIVGSWAIEKLEESFGGWENPTLANESSPEFLFSTDMVEIERVHKTETWDRDFYKNVLYYNDLEKECKKRTKLNDHLKKQKLIVPEP